MSHVPPGACIRPRGVLSATDTCLNGELISIPLTLPVRIAPLTPFAPFAVGAPLVGEDPKNSGDEDATLFDREARGVACELFCCCAERAGEFMCCELRVDRAGVPDTEFLCDRRDAGDDILKLRTISWSFFAQ